MQAGRVGPVTSLRWALAAVRLGWQASRPQLAGILGLTVVSGIVPVGSAWSVRALLDAVTRHPVPRMAAVVSVAALAGFGLASLGGDAVKGSLQTFLQRNVRVTVQARLFESIHAITGLAAFEDPRQLDRIRLAGNAGESAPSDVMDAGVTLAQAVITGAGFVVTLLVLAPWLVVVAVVAAVPTCLLELRLARLRAGVLFDTSVYHRRLVFYRILSVDVRAAKEIRLFGLGRFLTGRMLGDLRLANAAEAAVDWAAIRIQLVIALLTGLVTLFGAAEAAYGAAGGRFTAGDVTVVLAAMVALQATVAIMTDSVSTGYRDLLVFGEYLAVAEQRPAIVPGTEATPMATGIEFDDVWFRYGEDLPWVLRGVSCVLPAGATVGLVGLNGAGKTTMIKLLCRMYEPDWGCIRWDGTDIRTIDPVSLRRRISAVFQDFMAYDFTAADNIGVGSLDRLGDEGRVLEAARLVGIDETIQALPSGYQTLLSRIFPADDGGLTATLSGGQWQRIALARAFLRQDVDLLILDEPSSGLDAQVEHDLHETLGRLRAGRLSLLISHRLSALTSADLIIVVDGGRVLEQGTHRELTAAGGQYATMFDLQAAGYRGC